MKDLLKVLGCWVVWACSLLVGGLFNRILHLPLVAPGHETGVHFVALLIAGLVLAAGMVPLSNGLAAARAGRTAAIGLFLFLALGVNTVIEARVFSTMLDGVVNGNLVLYAIQAGMLGTALGMVCGQGGVSNGLRPLGLAGSWRWVAAWLGWPLIYFAFGMCVAPIVIPYYQSGAIAGLHIPPVGIILTTQLGRSIVFLASSLPLVALWKGSRGGLWFALGLAHAVAVGGFGLIAGTFLPMVLRVTHGIEITCDSFAYAGLLVLLFSGAEAGKSAVQPATELAGQRGQRGTVHR